MSGTAFRIGKVEGQIKELNSRIAKVNPCHESGSGRFCSTSGGGSGGGGKKPAATFPGSAARQAKRVAEDAGFKTSTTDTGMITGRRKNKAGDDLVAINPATGGGSVLFWTGQRRQWESLDEMSVWVKKPAGRT